MKIGTTFIIPTLNEEKTIENCLNLLKSTPSKIIVADGGSTDSTKEIADSFGVRVVESEPGRGQQIAKALEEVKTNYVMIVHADTLVFDLMSLMSDLFFISNTNRLTAIQWGFVKQRILGKGLKYRLLEKGNHLRAKIFRLPYGDQGIFFHVSLLKKIGGFPNLPLMEDVEFSLRARKVSKPFCLTKSEIFISARKWKSNGVIEQTIRNQYFLWRYLFRRKKDQKIMARIISQKY